MPEIATLEDEARRRGPWFHNLHLPGGVQTAPKHILGDFPRFKWDEIAPHLPDDLTGWTALDIGCNAGFYTFELAKRGARVVGIDLDPRYLEQARWAAKVMGLEEQVEFREMQVYDLQHTEERFDLVLFLGVFYHLRYPMLALDLVAQHTARRLVFQTLTMPGEEIRPSTAGLSLENRAPLLEPGWPKMAFFEHEFAGDPSNWFAPNRACVEALLRSAGMRVLARAGDETYVAEPDPENRPSIETWNRSEYLAALGKPWKDAGAAKVKPVKDTVESLAR